MNSRFETMRALLDAGRYFKLVCGAGNENREEVRKLALVYTLGGANGFDVSASPDVVRSCVEGIDRAYALAPQLGIEIPVRPFITISVGMPGDHHVRKAFIIDSCVDCGKCIPVCPTDAIPSDYQIIREQCIGCGNCEAACPPKVAAVRYEHNDRNLSDILPQCLDAGAENIELHAAVPNDDAIMQEWEIVNKVQPNHFVSICLDRYHLSNTKFLERVRQAKEVAGDRMIVQADGVPMGGSGDTYGVTLQTVATAGLLYTELISKDKAFRNLPVLLSGGTNGKTAELARLCEIPWGGIAIGTHARSIVKPFLIDPRFGDDLENLLSAATVAGALVKGAMRT